MPQKSASKKLTCDDKNLSITNFLTSKRGKPESAPAPEPSTSATASEPSTSASVSEPSTYALAPEPSTCATAPNISDSKIFEILESEPVILHNSARQNSLTIGNFLQRLHRLLKKNA